MFTTPSAISNQLSTVKRTHQLNNIVCVILVRHSPDPPAPCVRGEYKHLVSQTKAEKGKCVSHTQ